MKRIILALLIAISLTSCIRYEKECRVIEVEYGYFADSYYYTMDTLVLIECTVSPFLEGESMVSVWIHNKVWDTQNRKFIHDVELTTFMTTNDFLRELEHVERQPRLSHTVQFVTNYRGLEITWAMFDRIYRNYSDVNYR